MRTRLRALLFLLVCLLTLVFVHTCSFLRTPITPHKPVEVDIVPGQSAWEITQTLKNTGVISHAGTFIIIATLTGKAKHLRAGAYVFEGNHVPMDIMDILFRGKTLKYRITIPEGYTIYQIGEAVSRTGLIPKNLFIQSALSPKTKDFFQVKAPSMEGFLYPDTYYLVPHMTPLEIMAKMIDRFRGIYTPEMEQRAKAIGMSKLEVITLASLIEKEAYAKAEQPIISSVFHNRMMRGMRLQSDPTAIYGIEGFTGKIGPDDLLRESPYNTYRHGGLPPGPICNPGLDSIRSALWPAKTTYLYFVSQGDGTHSFSHSLEEHNRAISNNSKQKKNRGIL
ncbi:MAG: endolytic transglycosylase MltG [Desulfomonilia bacterium]|jgi:UPF0755 protein